MSNAKSPILTPRDFAVLESLLAAPEESFPGAAILLRRKLHAATLVFATDVGPDVVTLNSRIRYTIDGGAAQEHTLVAGDKDEPVEAGLRVDSMRGMALLGVRAGRSIAVERTDGSFETLHIEAVLYQPEAHSRETSQDEPAPRTRPALVAVSGAIPAMPTTGSVHNMGKVSQLSAYRLRRAVPVSDHDGGDDPGPSAA